MQPVNANVRASSSLVFGSSTPQFFQDLTLNAQQPEDSALEYRIVGAFHQISKQRMEERKVGGEQAWRDVSEPRLSPICDVE
ncbi:MAG: hypothetical protein KDA75_22090 [Planctomycetaceae bacterium]|nr:hypothetical protein [Planctomycetaceae bacterium]